MQNRFTVLAFLYIDTKGRRFLLLPSLAGVTISLLALAFCFYAPETRESLRTGLVTFFIIFFTAFYSIGLGPVPYVPTNPQHLGHTDWLPSRFTLSAEVFPLATRGKSIKIWNIRPRGRRSQWLKPLGRVRYELHGLSELLSTRHLNPLRPVTYAQLWRWRLQPRKNKSALLLCVGSPPSEPPIYRKTQANAITSFLSAVCFLLSFAYVRATSRPKLVEMAYICQFYKIFLWVLLS
jgi:hypothetical protein